MDLKFIQILYRGAVIPPFSCWQYVTDGGWILRQQQKMNTCILPHAGLLNNCMNINEIKSGAAL